MQHLTTLLAASDPGVVIATLQAFVALVRKTHIASIRYPGGPEQNARLLALAQGWGGKEQVSAVFNAVEPVYSTPSDSVLTQQCNIPMFFTGSWACGMCT